MLEIAAGARGRITDVAVNVGDLVREGQVVARVAQPDVLNRIRQVRLSLESLRVEHRLVTTHSEEEAALRLAQLRQAARGDSKSRSPPRSTACAGRARGSRRSNSSSTRAG